MKEQIKQALEQAKNAHTITFRLIAENDLKMNHVEWLRWQNERIEQLEKALEDLSTDGIAVEEATHEELCEFIASVKRKIDQALGKEE